MPGMWGVSAKANLLKSGTCFARAQAYLLDFISPKADTFAPAALSRIARVVWDGLCGERRRGKLVYRVEN